MADGLKRTPLHREHVELGGKMVPFAGFEMPVQYPEGIRAEHQAVRNEVGLFDVSHMGEVEIRGSGAVKFLQHLAINDVGRISEGQAQYSAMCQEDGGVLDDLLVYRFPDRFMLVVNAANRDSDLSWIREQAGRFEAEVDGEVEVEDVSDRIALLALQGPRAAEVLAPLTEVDLGGLSYYRFRTAEAGGVKAVISRTGYTGEDGFELYVDAADARTLWSAILHAGGGGEVAPAGLGARDSLRLEMGYPLYGNDLDRDHTPLEAGLGWITRLERDVPFVGSQALRSQKDRGPERKLVGIGLRERGFPRPGYPVTRNGEPVGSVTSGTVSPTLERGIALAYVPVELAEPGMNLAVRIRDQDVAATVEHLPFYTHGSLRR